MNRLATRILLTCIDLAERRGTQTMIRNTAARLLGRGLSPCVYTLQQGEIAEELRAIGIPVVTDIAAIQETPDLIHGFHNTPTVIAAARFPDVPAIFVCNDFVAWHDAPPLLPSITHYVAVSDAGRDRFVIESGIAPERVVLCPNGVELDRVSQRSALPEQPAQIVAYVKGAGFSEAVRLAGARSGLGVTLIGALAGREMKRPEDVLPQADVVIGTGLSALEGMACGCAVICADQRGSAGMISTGNLDRLRNENFGLRTLRDPISAGALCAALAAYDPTNAAAVSGRVRSEMNFAHYIESLSDIYARSLAAHRAAPPEVARSDLARHLQGWLPNLGTAWPWQIERDEMARKITELRQAHADVASQKAYMLAETILFSQAGDGVRYQDFGWGQTEDWGVWTEGAQARLTLELVPGEPQALRIECLAAAFAKPTKVQVRANGRLAAIWSFEEGAPVLTRAFLVPATWLEASRLRLDFAIDRPVSPAELGMNDDRRQLGLGLMSLKVLPAAGAPVTGPAAPRP